MVVITPAAKKQLRRYQRFHEHAFFLRIAGSMEDCCCFLRLERDTAVRRGDFVIRETGFELVVDTDLMKRCAAIHIDYTNSPHGCGFTLGCETADVDQDARRTS